MFCEYGLIFSRSILGVNDFYRDLWGCGIYFSWSAHPCSNRESFQTSGQFITFTKYHSVFLGWSCVNGSIYTLSWLLFWYLKRCWILKNHSLSVKSHLLEFTLAEWFTNFSLVLEHMILFWRSRVRLRITIMMVPSKRHIDTIRYFMSYDLAFLWTSCGLFLLKYSGNKWWNLRTFYAIVEFLALRDQFIIILFFIYWVFYPPNWKKKFTAPICNTITGMIY